MGAYAGAGSVRDGSLNPRLFVAVGASPDLGARGLPLLLMTGQFDEVFPPAQLKARTDGRLVVSPWCDHALETYDSQLVNTAVAAACAAVGRTPPAPPASWHWRLAGMMIGVLGALALAFCLPAFPPQWSWVRGLLVPAIYLVALVLTTGTWLGVEPLWRRLPLYLAYTAVGMILVFGAAKLRLRRWSFLALAVALWLGCFLGGARVLAFLLSLFTLILMVATVLGALAARRGTRRDADLALVFFMGYALGQWLPMTY
jgi:hypothetical protein